MPTHNRWMLIILALMLVSATAVQMVSAETAHVANHVVISEVQIDGIAGSGGTEDDWIELYNPTNVDIDLAANDYRLERRTAAGSTTDVFMEIGNLDHGSYPGGTIIPAHGFYLIVRDDANTDLQANADAIGTHGKFTLTDSNSIYLATGSISDSPDDMTDPDLVDLMGYGAALSFEGSGQAPAPLEGESIERKAIASSIASDMAAPSGAHYNWGNGEDTNNNSADFITKTSPEPQNSSSDTEDCPAQSWFLHNDGVMYKENTSKPEGTVTVANGGSSIWKADEPAAVNVGFPAGTWAGKITLSEIFANGETFTVEVGFYEDSTFTSAGLQICTGTAGKTTFSLEIQATAFDISNGNYLALNITNPSDGSGDLVIKTGGGNSYVTSPSTDPAYPVPELPTIILFSAGLLILAGYVYMGKRNK